MIIWPRQEGIYVVVFMLSEHRVITVGKHGKTEFKPGIYYYCGSAKGRGGLQKRIKRHLDEETTKFWHIDFLKIIARPIQVWYLLTTEVLECELVQAIKTLPEIALPMSGFGSSDCKSQCGSHLAFSFSAVNIDEVFREMKNRFSGLEQAILI